MFINFIIGWLLRIAGGAIIVVGWLVFTGSITKIESYSLEFMTTSIVYPIIASVIGLIILILGVAVGRTKK